MLGFGEIGARCSACSAVDKDMCRLTCIHTICLECFNRYVLGSLKELKSCLRCCLCGRLTKLIQESQKEEPLMRIGRHQTPEVSFPRGLYAHDDGFVLSDHGSKRVCLLDQFANVEQDFAYLHGYEACQGLLITKDRQFVIVPLKNAMQTCLAYYNMKGIFVTSSYLPSGADVSGMCLTGDGEILATDGASDKVHLINNEKILESSWSLPRLLGEDHDSRTSGIACNSNDHLYVTDSANHCVKVTDKTGKFLFKFGSQGQRPTQFNNPTGITIDNKDRVLVADRGNNRVQLFTPEGRFIRFIVRYHDGDDVYMGVSSVSHTADNIVSVLLTAINAAPAGEVRLYWTND